MATEKSKQQAMADKRHAVRISLKFNKMQDYEIVQWLSKQPNKQDAIRQAILHYMDYKDEKDE